MNEAQESNTKQRRYFRFSIAMLLVLMAMVAGYLSGYQLGWIESAKNEEASRIISMLYDVSDLIKPLDAEPEWIPTKDDYAQLLNLLTRLTPLEYKKATGDRDEIIRVYLRKEAMVVNGTRKTHKQLGDLLKQLRRNLPEYES